MPDSGCTYLLLLTESSRHAVAVRGKVREEDNGDDLFAIISDIHSNYHALQAVLDDIAGKDVSAVYCLGDIVGYGPAPTPCLSLVRKHCAICLKGNHDLAVTFEPLGFNQLARQAALWTRKQLKPGFISSVSTAENWAYLNNLIERHTENNMLFVHGSPRDPVMEYITAGDVLDVALGPSDKIQSVFAAFEGVCFVGHTHTPGVVTPDFKFLSPKDINNEFAITTEKAIVNVGSVGQPRDGDSRACYVTVDSSLVRYHRVEYDIEAVVKAIEEIEEIDNRIAYRLREGK